jgi:hypothetical protein
MDDDQVLGVRPQMKHCECTAILAKNKKAFEQMATGKIHHPA